MVFLILSGCSSEYQEVNITIEEFRFTPTELHLLPNQPIRLRVKNQGRELHRLKSQVLSVSEVRKRGEVEAPTVDLKQGLAILPGKSVELIFTLPSGMYEFRCPIRGHRGMAGMFVVETAGRE